MIFEASSEPAGYTDGLETPICPKKYGFVNRVNSIHLWPWLSAISYNCLFPWDTFHKWGDLVLKKHLMTGISGHNCNIPGIPRRCFAVSRRSRARRGAAPPNAAWDVRGRGWRPGRQRWALTAGDVFFRFFIGKMTFFERNSWEILKECDKDFIGMLLYMVFFEM